MGLCLYYHVWLMMQGYTTHIHYGHHLAIARLANEDNQ